MRIRCLAKEWSATGQKVTVGEPPSFFPSLLAASGQTGEYFGSLCGLFFETGFQVLPGSLAGRHWKAIQLWGTWGLDLG